MDPTTRRAICARWSGTISFAWPPIRATAVARLLSRTRPCGFDRSPAGLVEGNATSGSARAIRSAVLHAALDHMLERLAS